MNENEMPERIFKESLKKLVDNSPNFSDQMKWDIKAIIDAGNTPEEILVVAFSYLSKFQW